MSYVKKKFWAVGSVVESSSSGTQVPSTQKKERTFIKYWQEGRGWGESGRVSGGRGRPNKEKRICPHEQNSLRARAMLSPRTPSPLFVSHAHFLKYIYSNITMTNINSDISFLVAALLYLNSHFIWPLLKTSLFLKLYSLLFPPNFPSFIKQHHFQALLLLQETQSSPYSKIFLRFSIHF